MKGRLLDSEYRPLRAFVSLLLVAGALAYSYHIQHRLSDALHKKDQSSLNFCNEGNERHDRSLLKARQVTNNPAVKREREAIIQQLVPAYDCAKYVQLRKEGAPATEALRPESR